MDEMTNLVKAHKNKGVLLDANLLLVYLIGMFDPERLNKFKRTAAFAVDDFYLLSQLVHFLGRIVTTPNILTEVNSFSNKLSGAVKKAYYAEFARRIVLMEEHYIASEQVSSSASFERLGLTDLVIETLARDRYLVLTEDLKLTHHLHSLGIAAINFNHVRDLNWH
jgi:rRNA-processing protein FCF1